jgi:hypothetical protein
VLDVIKYLLCKYIFANASLSIINSLKIIFTNCLPLSVMPVLKAPTVGGLLSGIHGSTGSP